MSGAMMRMLMILAVLLCSMHLAESASAHASDDAPAFHIGSDDREKDTREPASKIAHGSHHCPVALDQWAAAPDLVPALKKVQVFAASFAALPSRASPPLLDPPLA